MVIVKLKIPDDAELKEVMRKRFIEVMNEFSKADVIEMFESANFEKKIKKMVENKFDSSYSYRVSSKIEQLILQHIQEQTKDIDVHKMYEEELRNLIRKQLKKVE